MGILRVTLYWSRPSKKPPMLALVPLLKSASYLKGTATEGRARFGRYRGRYSSLRRAVELPDLGGPGVFAGEQVVGAAS